MTLKNEVGFPGPDAQKVRVIVADPYPVILHGLRKMIEDDERFQVVAAVPTLARFVMMVAVERPHVALLDSCIAMQSPELVLPLLRSKRSSTAIILLATSKNPDENPDISMLGASTILSKWCSAEQLRAAISRACSPLRHASKAQDQAKAIAAVLPAGPANCIAQLTKRERQILPLVCRGMRNKEIAEQLGIAESTVWHHLTSVFTKLDVGDRLGLVTFAYRHNLVDEPDESLPISAVQSA
jgi:DNA-binding NarL/FixJ family response regulator